MTSSQSFSDYEVHRLLNLRSGNALTTYQFRTLVSCWRIKKGLPDITQESFSQTEVKDFLAYAY